MAILSVKREARESLGRGSAASSEIRQSGVAGSLGLRKWR